MKLFEISVSSVSLSEKLDPPALYFKMLREFQKLLEDAGLIKRKEDGVYKRRRVTFHSFRRFVRTTMANAGYKDYSEWFLGHTTSPYYVNKSQTVKDIYKKEMMPSLTFLDIQTIQLMGSDYK